MSSAEIKQVGPKSEENESERDVGGWVVLGWLSSVCGARCVCLFICLIASALAAAIFAERS